MNSGRIIFSQLMDHIPYNQFTRIVEKYNGDYKCKHFTCKSHFYCMAFGQLTNRNSLRDIVVFLRANQNKLHRMGICGGVSLNNLSNASMNRDWRIYAEFAQVLINTAGNLMLMRSSAKRSGEQSSARGVLRRVRYRDPEDGDVYVFLSNNLDLPATTIASLYKARWQVELFFKWIKQHLRIKAFFGHNRNAVKTQVWIAFSVYVLMAILRKRLQLERFSLYNILQVLSVSPFCYDELQQLFTDGEFLLASNNNPNQLILFDL